MSKIISILKNIKPDCDFENSLDYLEDGLLDSLTIITLLTEIENICGIEIDVVDIDEEDLINEESLLKMTERFGGDISLLQ
ncbi:MAG: hypothetical protein IJS03_06825 [Eubacterium sp.]|nr:hypothetical protein [Eubacterium sp.]